MSNPGTNKVDFHVRDDGIAIVTLDHYPVNTLTNAVQLGIEDSCERISKDKSIKGVVVCGAGTRALCAGADIQDLNKKHERYPKKAFMESFEQLQVPVVAAMQGFSLGGGFELCLGCHYRVIASNGFLGLPEVNIGLLPGGQGTQRLPRLIGAQPAMDLMLSGAHVSAKKALGWKVVDKVVNPNDLLDASIALAKEMSVKNPTNAGRRISELPGPKVDQTLLDRTTSLMNTKRRGESAPQKIIQCVGAACTMPFKQGCAEEQRLFKQLVGSREANALQHIFFAERAAGKIAGLKAKPKPIKKVGIVGAGLMGGGIGMCFANTGIAVVFIDQQQKFLDKGLSVVKGHYARSVKRGSKTQAAVDAALALMSGSVDYSSLSDVDLVIEAVFEDMKVKKEIFAKLDKVCKPGCILASNTSYLSIDKIASATSRPGDVIGMHFFSPANVMKLLENVRGAKSSDTTIATAMAVATKIGKVAVLAGNCHGFIANRMFGQYLGEANEMLQEGSDLVTIDSVAEEFGLPVGPFRLSDLTGLTVGFERRKRLGLVFPDKNIKDWLVENGRLGMKTSKGFFDYTPERKRIENKEVNNQIMKIRANCGITQRKIDNQEIFERLLFPIINEGFKILEEGFADKPSDIDVALCLGYNWPRVTGGPMWYADTMDGGLEKLLAALTRMSNLFPDKKHFKPSNLLVECVQSNMPLAKFWAKNGQRFKVSGKSKL